MHRVPRVSVVLPVFNAEPYVGEAVESILAQSLADFELIAIDDGSTDGSPGILTGFAARDSRVRVITRENRGLAATLNEGIGLATAAYCAIMNADDISLPERLAKQAAFLDAHPHVAAVGSQTRFFAAGASAAPATSLPESPAAARRFLATASPLAEQRCDPADRHTAVEPLRPVRRDLEELLAVALRDKVFGRHAELVGQDHRNPAFRERR